MAHEIVMPQLGLTMTEGSVTLWLKQSGERIEKGEPLFSVATDKVEMEVESTASGTVETILVEPGQMVNVGTVIATISDGSQPQPKQPVAAEPEIVASPRAKKRAKELGVDIGAVRPSNGHRIVEEDVRAYHEAHGAKPATAQPQAQPKPQPQLVPVPQKRKIAAERLSASFQQAPHFYLGVELNANELVRMRTQLIEPVQARTGVKLTYTDFFLMCLAKSLAEQPNVNASWQNDGIVANSSVDVAFAVQAADGLLAPVIRGADRLSLPDLARQRQALSEKARNGQLKITEMEGGSATLSNLGQFGVDWFQAILNPPQSVIVATGRIAKKPFVVDDRLEVANTVTVTLSADHRVLDGVAAAQFLARIKELLEKPYIFLL